LLIPPPPRSTLFPYTTLFRSHVRHLDVEEDAREVAAEDLLQRLRAGVGEDELLPEGLGDRFEREEVLRLVVDQEDAGADQPKNRSEEHTSELQSLTNLVCPLL